MRSWSLRGRDIHDTGPVCGFGAGFSRRDSESWLSESDESSAWGDRGSVKTVLEGLRTWRVLVLTGSLMVWLRARRWRLLLRSMATESGAAQGTRLYMSQHREAR